MPHGIDPLRKFIRWSGYTGEPADVENIANRISGLDESNSYRPPPSVYSSAFLTPEEFADAYGWNLRTLNDIDRRIYLMELIVTNIEAGATAWDAAKTIAAIEAYGAKIMCDVDLWDGHTWADLLDFVQPVKIPKSRYEITGDKFDTWPSDEIYPTKCCYDDNGNVYISTYEFANGARIYKVNLQTMAVVDDVYITVPGNVHYVSNLAFDGENIIVLLAHNDFQPYTYPPTFSLTGGFYTVLDVSFNTVKAVTALPANALDPFVIVVSKNNSKAVIGGCEGFGIGGEQAWFADIALVTYNVSAITQLAANCGTLFGGATGGQSVETVLDLNPGAIHAGSQVVMIGYYDDGIGNTAKFLIEIDSSTSPSILHNNFTGPTAYLTDAVNGFYCDICFASEKYWILCLDNWTGTLNNLLEVDPHDLDNAGALKYIGHFVDWKNESGDFPLSLIHDGWGNLFVTFFDKLTLLTLPGGSGKGVHVKKVSIMNTFGVGYQVDLRACVYEDQANNNWFSAICMTRHGVFWIENMDFPPFGRQACNIWGP